MKCVLRIRLLQNLTVAQRTLYKMTTAQRVLALTERPDQRSESEDASEASFQTQDCACYSALAPTAPTRYPHLGDYPWALYSKIARGAFDLCASVLVLAVLINSCDIFTAFWGETETCCTADDGGKTLDSDLARLTYAGVILVGWTDYGDLG
ncbi:hypothetical protein K525DRAFT_245658 [Schizophyllum commune Loenen D]|nr:hypothetical protein K525DRAFT_245658 [Schizophyllum commune Loenen D]